MSKLEHDLKTSLEKLREQHLARELKTPDGVDFSSNDYLGLAKLDAFSTRLAAKLSESSESVPASRLLRGHLPAHENLENRLAEFKGTESALLFSTGYQANLGVLTALVSPDDRVISDEFNHASIIDGLRLSKASKRIIKHLDVSELESVLSEKWTSGRTFVVTESLFSMDGDIAPLDRYADLCEEYGAELIVDDSHAIGVFGGERGSGLTEHFGVEQRTTAVVSTFGKALGFFGGFVGASEPVIQWLVNRARTFIFTTAQPPAVTCGIEVALDLLAENHDRRAKVLELAEGLRSSLAAASISTLGSESPIVPVILETNARALAVADAVRREGFDVRAIRPPTVPRGTSRLRISVHADHTAEQVNELALAIIATTGALPE